MRLSLSLPLTAGERWIGFFYKFGSLAMDTISGVAVGNRFAKTAGRRRRRIRSGAGGWCPGNAIGGIDDNVRKWLCNGIPFLLVPLRLLRRLVVDRRAPRSRRGMGCRIFLLLLG